MNGNSVLCFVKVHWTRFRDAVGKTFQILTGNLPM